MFYSHDPHMVYLLNFLPILLFLNSIDHYVNEFESNNVEFFNSDCITKNHLAGAYFLDWCSEKILHLLLFCYCLLPFIANEASKKILTVTQLKSIGTAIHPINLVE